MARRKATPSPPDEELELLLDELKWRPPRRPKDPTAIGTLISGLMSRKGYSQSAVAVTKVLGSAEPLKQMRPGDVKRGVFEIHVTHPALVQELSFQQSELLSVLKQLIPDQKIRSLRFRVGTI
jgi:hypothetical protein